VLFRSIPMQPWAEALYDYRVRTEQKDDPEGFCLPPGGVGATSNRTAAPWEFVQMPQQKRIIRVFEGETNIWQIIYMDGRPHPPDVYDIPTWMGHAVGHWEGDTLVVDTVGFNEGTWIDLKGHPHTNQMHVIEKYTRTSLKNLHIEVAIDDPGAYTRPWTVAVDLARSPDREIEDYFCQENN